MNTTPSIHRLVPATLGIAVATVLLSGCLSAQIPGSPPPRTPLPPDTAGVSPELLPFYDQDVLWEECYDTFDCATISAPLDWENPGASEIELAVVRAPATGTAVGSLITNPGGPGGSGVEFIAESLDWVVGTPLIENFDVVGFDPRGVGESTAVTCLNDADMDAYLYDIPADPRGSDGWTAELEQRAQEFADACEANSGGILPYITTVNSARDMDLLRGVLGDSQLNYLGFSYGTFLGATYAELFPERVGRLVLDGAIDPATSGYEVGTIQALGFESALRAYMQGCLDGEDCPFEGTVDEALADVGALFASLDAQPLPVGGRQLGADSAVTGTIVAMYNQENWPLLTDAFEEVLQGNGRTMMFLADFYNSRDQSGRYLDNSTNAFRAYNCMDYPIEDDPAAEERSRQMIAEGAPTFAPYWEGVDSCAAWPYPPTGTRGPIAAPGTDPILVVGTTNDPATPFEWSVALAEQLDSGVLVIRVGEGHTGYFKGNTCVDDVVEAYLIDGTVPDGDVHCE